MSVSSTRFLGPAATVFAFVGFAGSQAQAQTIFSASGANPAAIQTQVDAFRTALGTDNGSTPGSQGTGRREVNWDGVTDQESAPGQIAGDFFNTVLPRGSVEIPVSPTTGFQLSADTTNPTTSAVEFGNLDPSYTTDFAVFSAERLFTPLGGTTFDVVFRIPGSQTPAAVRAFGAVFTDVDLEASATLQFFQGNVSLGTQEVPFFAGDGGLSFLAVDFVDPIVTRVRVVCGTAALANGTLDVTSSASNPDVAALDDFIYGEPVAITATYDAVLAEAELLKTEIQALALPNKVEKDLIQDINQVINAAEEAAAKDALGQANGAKKSLKPAASHLRNFEKALRSKGAVNEIDETTLRNLSQRAATLGVDIALLTLFEGV